MLLVFGMVSQANALAIGDDYYVGKIVDGVPSGESFEVGYINYLITLGVDETKTYDGQYYDRTDGISGPFTIAVINANDRLEFEETATSNSFDATDVEYIIGKYDQKKAGSLIWYLGEDYSGMVTLPDALNGQGLSHISGYNQDGSYPVPEPATGLIYVFGLVGIAGISRKMPKK
jgi:hypothetical protein